MAKFTYDKYIFTTDIWWLADYLSKQVAQGYKTGESKTAEVCAMLPK